MHFHSSMRRGFLDSRANNNGHNNNNLGPLRDERSSRMTWSEYARCQLQQERLGLGLAPTQTGFQPAGQRPPSRWGRPSSPPLNNESIDMAHAYGKDVSVEDAPEDAAVTPSQVIVTEPTSGTSQLATFKTTVPLAGMPPAPPPQQDYQQQSLAAGLKRTASGTTKGTAAMEWEENDDQSSNPVSAAAARAVQEEMQRSTGVHFAPDGNSQYQFPDDRTVVTSISASTKSTSSSASMAGQKSASPSFLQQPSSMTMVVSTDAMTDSTTAKASAFPGGGDNTTIKRKPPPLQQPQLPYKRPPPVKQALVPKAALYTWCNKPPLRIALGGDNYVTFDNGALPHMKRYTSVFVDPRNGECFGSGPYGDPKFYEIDREKGVTWYTTKKFAEHGAAAVAYDCLTFRHSQQQQQPHVPNGLDQEPVAYEQIGSSSPYTEARPYPGVSIMPDTAREKFESVIAAARNKAVVASSSASLASAPARTGPAPDAIHVTGPTLKSEPALCSPAAPVPVVCQTQTTNPGATSLPHQLQPMTNRPQGPHPSHFLQQQLHYPAQQQPYSLSQQKPHQPGPMQQQQHHYYPSQQDGCFRAPPPLPQDLSQQYYQQSHHQWFPENPYRGIEGAGFHSGHGGREGRNNGREGWNAERDNGGGRYGRGLPRGGGGGRGRSNSTEAQMQLWRNHAPH